MRALLTDGLGLSESSDGPQTSPPGERVRTRRGPPPWIAHRAHRIRRAQRHCGHRLDLAGRVMRLRSSSPTPGGRVRRCAVLTCSSGYVLRTSRVHVHPAQARTKQRNARVCRSRPRFLRWGSTEPGSRARNQLRFTRPTPTASIDMAGSFRNGGSAP